jgi:O-antigen/teichoic acid export membrane protein
MNLKLFGKNALIYAIGTICLRAAPFLLIPLYTHSLSISDYGLLATLLMTIQILITFMDLGTRKGFTRFATEYESKNLIGHLLSSSILIIVAGGSIVTGISVLFLLPFFRSVLHTDQVLGYIVLTCCAAAAFSLFNLIIAYYRARNESMKYMIINFSSSMLLIVVNLVFLVIFHQGIRGVLAAQIITYGSLWLFVSLNVFSNTGIGFSMQLTGKLFRFGFPLVFAAGGRITEVSGLYFLSYFATLEQVAIYSLGHRIAEIADVVLIQPFQLAYEPFVYAHIDKPEVRVTIAKLLTYLMLAFAFVAFGVAFVSRDLLRVIAPPEYFSAYSVISLMLPGIAFKGVYYIGESLLHIKNKTYITGTMVTVFTVLSVILNYLLIPHWGIYGVIAVFNVTAISKAVLLMILGLKAFPIRLELERLGVAGILLVSFLTTAFFLSETSPYIYYSVLPIAACVSVAFIYFENFYDDHEKAVLRGLLYGIRSKVSSRKF